MKETTVDMMGNICNAIEEDGKIYIQPWFWGQLIGTVVKAFPTDDGHGYHFLLLTDQHRRIGSWITLTNSEIDRFDLFPPFEESVIYFLVHQKRWHKSHTLPYRVAECWYMDDYYDEPINQERPTL